MQNANSLPFRLPSVKAAAASALMLEPHRVCIVNFEFCILH
jgi:hypothetical protein